MRYPKSLTPSPTMAISALFAIFELYESHAMYTEVAIKWLAYLIAIGRPNSDP